MIALDTNVYQRSHLLNIGAVVSVPAPISQTPIATSSKIMNPFLCFNDPCATSRSLTVRKIHSDIYTLNLSHR